MVLKSNIDAIGGSVLGAVSSLLVTTNAAPPPYDGAPQWLGYLMSLFIAVAPLALKGVARWYSGEAAGNRVRAAKKRTRAAKLHAAGKFDEAIKLEAEADELEAQAAEDEARARGGQ